MNHNVIDVILFLMGWGICTILHHKKKLKVLKDDSPNVIDNHAEHIRNLYEYTNRLEERVKRLEKRVIIEVKQPVWIKDKMHAMVNKLAMIEEQLFKMNSKHES